MNKIHSIYDAPFIKEMQEMTRNLWLKGWAEANGGNISYRLDEEHVAPFLDLTKTVSEFDLNFEVPELAGKYFLVSRSGSFFRKVTQYPASTLVIVQINSNGKSYRVLWGLEDGGRPTVEFSSHLLSHVSRLKQDPEHRVILHTHATNVIAMTFIQDINENKFTRALWGMITECMVLFPEGIAVLPWMGAGTVELGKATAQKMELHRLVVWAHHGILGAGKTLDDAFGLVETVDKAAEVFMKAAAVSKDFLSQITNEELKFTANFFGLKYKQGIID